MTTTAATADSSLLAMAHDMAVTALTKDPTFIIGLEHVNEGETELAKTQRFKRLATKLGVSVDTLTAAKEATAPYGALLRDTPTGHYKLTRDIVNPSYDARCSKRDIAGHEVIPAGTAIVVTQYTSEIGDFRFPSIEIFGEVHGRPQDPVIVRMLLSNMVSAPVTNLKDAVRADDIEDYHFKMMVMRLLDQGRITLDEVRGSVREFHKMTEDEDTALYARHGFKS